MLHIIGDCQTASKREIPLNISTSCLWAVLLYNTLANIWCDSFNFSHFHWVYTDLLCVNLHFIDEKMITFSFVYLAIFIPYFLWNIFKSYACFLKLSCLLIIELYEFFKYSGYQSIFNFLFMSLVSNLIFIIWK